LKPGFRFAAWLVAGLALAAAAPLAALTISSPLTFPTRRGIAVERAAAVGDRLLDLQPTALARLRSVPLREAVRLEQFPFAPDATGDLVLERFEIASPDARILVRGSDGESSLQLPTVVHFEGRLDGDPDSRVYVGIPGSFLIATVKTSAGLVYIGPEGATEGPVQHVLRRADSVTNAGLAPLEWHCDVEELPQAPVGAENRSAGGENPLTLLAKPAAASLSAMEATSLKDAAISVETDQELLAKFAGNVSAMSSYITTLLAQNSLIYERDLGVHLTVNRIQAWTSTDPYVATNTMGQLNEVGDWWHANRPKASYPRTTVIFLSGKPVTGGVAWLDVLCMNDFSQGGHWGGAYAVVQVAGNYPSNLWDLLASAHEMGHNFGSPHTHCFSPPIDMCYGSESGCYSGPTVNPGPLGGTIMSYCHLLAGGYGNIDMRFHERCINEQMLPEINSVSCLTTIPDAPPAAASFYTLTPCRVIDTRNPSGPYGGPALGANTERSFTMGGRCGIPTTARAVSVNLTVTQGTAAGALKMFPSGITVPTATAINYRGGQTRANNSLSQLSSGGSLTIRCEQISGNVHAIIDVNGYYQ
jgi:Metallo-peptidase family M12